MALLPPAPSTISRYKEFAVFYASGLPEYYNALSTQEKIFAYYLWRASLPGNSIIADQKHKNARELIEIFQHIFLHQDKLPDDYKSFIEESKIYLVYLWANHGNYFCREETFNKRTPALLKLSRLTPERLIKALELTGVANAAQKIDKLKKTIFDATYEPTLTVPDSIEQSAINFYSDDFTEQDYALLSPEQRALPNAYFSIAYHGYSKAPLVERYSAQEKYSHELLVALYWLEKAYEYAQQNSDFFDDHLIASIKYLIKFLNTGDMQAFNQHSIAWIASTSKIDYSFGFIESYEDPKKIRCLFQAEATIKIGDMKKLSMTLLKIEESLPFGDAFKRNTRDSQNNLIANASINYQIFGTGDLGPVRQTLAYCLPNDEAIRAEYGSKQIIYKVEQDLGMLINPEISKELNYLSEQISWFKKHDKSLSLVSELLNLHVILHETIGHASGRLASHIFQAGDQLTIEGKHYEIGSQLDVTNTNIPELLLGFEQTLEELRAEIIALYVTTFHLEELLALGYLSSWHTLLTPEQIIEWSIITFAQVALRKFIRMPDDAQEIAGDHARADHTIMNYLLSHGGLELVYEQRAIGQKLYTIPGFRVHNLGQTKQAIKELTALVQTIKSTGDGQQAKKLISTYGMPINDKELFLLIKTNYHEIMEGLKAAVTLYPDFKPVFNKSGIIQDIIANWPNNIFEQQIYYSKIATSKE